MPKIATPLSNAEIKNAKPKSKSYSLSDGRGLSLSVKPDGIKAWQFLFTSPTVYKRRKTSFKTYPAVSLIQARQKRDECLDLINQGIDPIDHKREERTEDIIKAKDRFSTISLQKKKGTHTK